MRSRASQQEVKSSSDGGQVIRLDRQLKVLDARHIVRIDDALAKIGPFAEVRLIKTKGRLRFIQTLESEDLLGEP